jgi:two-component system chemotaxis sensor kinase CheA
MTLDMTQFHPVFFEETAEHVATMEALLLYLDAQDPDPEQLEDLGRAAHPIKGSGGTFGFRDMAHLAEAVEMLVASVRKGRQPLSGKLVGALREACRTLRQLLAGYRGEGAAEADAAARATALLRGLLAQRPDGRDVAAPARSGKVSPPEAAPDLAAAHEEVMALVEAAGAGGLREVTAAVRELGEAIERNAALVEQAAENTEMLRESFRALVQAIAVMAMAPPARPRPLPKVRRTSATAGDGKEWPEF